MILLNIIAASILWLLLEKQTLLDPELIVILLWKQFLEGMMQLMFLLQRIEIFPSFFELEVNNWKIGSFFIANMQNLS